MGRHLDDDEVLRSGPGRGRNAMLERVRKLLDAVKSAREEANGLEVKPQKVGTALLGWIFEGSRITQWSASSALDLD